jgi:acetyl-CoA acyltransferase
MTSPATISELYGEPWTARMWERYDFVPEGESAELIAERWDLSRQELDEFAARSHRLAAAAVEAGRFDAELIAWELDGEVRRGDQTVRPVDPVIMLTGPVPATRKLLERNGLSISDIDLFEVDEAFSSVVLAWARELEPDMDRVDVNGGAIAQGHPVGATGGRLLATVVAEMERRDVELGLVTMCCGGGLGTATLVQRAS